MKGCIFIPNLRGGSGYCGYGAYVPLFELIEKNLGFERIIWQDADSFKKLYDYDVVITFRFPSHLKVFQSEDIVFNLPKNIKVIGYFVDMHRTASTKTRRKRFSKLMERCDKIVYTYDEAFKNRWPQFIEKAEWIPQFLSLSDFVKKMPENINPINKCLISGAIRKKYYPLRFFASKYLSKDNLIDILKTPKFTKKPLIKYDYVSHLHKYLCCLSSCSIYKYTVRKNFEIPSTGSILLSDTCEDMKKLGFIPSVNYVEVNEENLEKTIKDIINHPEDYEHIRENGKKFVLENHTEYHRFEQFKRIIEEL